MTGDYFLYFENSFCYNNGENTKVRNRLVPVKQIKRIWELEKYFCVATDGYSDLYIEKKTQSETILDFYGRSYVPIPSQVVIDSNT